jgi:hypothetical protein
VLRFFSGVKLIGCEGDHSLPLSVKFKKEWSCNSARAV